MRKLASRETDRAAERRAMWRKILGMAEADRRHMADDMEHVVRMIRDQDHQKFQDEIIANGNGRGK